MRNFAKKKYEAGTACSLLQVSAGIGLTAVTSTSDDFNRPLTLNELAVF
jgi:hypothetical protein